MTLRCDEAQPPDNRAPWLAGSNTAAHILGSSGEHESSQTQAENFHQETASGEKGSLFRLSAYKLYIPFMVSGKCQNGLSPYVVCCVVLEWNP